MAAAGYREQNRRAWDKRTGVHLGSRFYDVEGFLAGGSSLKPPEIALAGDVRGLRLLHLQCHFGLDTLSWARRGAIVTGVDFSPASVAQARLLAGRSGLQAEFVCADVQALGNRFGPVFDVVLSSYGVLCWLDDLESWAAGIRRSLLPGGRFILVEYHPVLDLLLGGKLSGSASYFPAGPVCRESAGTYTDSAHAPPIAYRECRWQHPLSEVVGAVLGAGMTLTGFQEYPYSSFRLFDALEELKGGVWHPGSEAPRIPYMFSIVADAPGD